MKKNFLLSLVLFAKFGAFAQCISTSGSSISVGCLTLPTPAPIGSIIMGYTNLTVSSDSSVVIGNRVVTSSATRSHTVVGNNINISASNIKGTVAIGDSTTSLPVTNSGTTGTTLVGSGSYGSGTTLGFRDTAMLYENALVGNECAARGTAGAGPVFMLANKGKSFPSLSNHDGKAGIHVLIGDYPWASGYVNYIIGGGNSTAHNFISCWACLGGGEDLANADHQAYLGYYNGSNGKEDFDAGQGLYNDWFIGGPDSTRHIHAITTSIPSRSDDTSNADGVNWTFRGSRATGNAASGEIIFKTGSVGTSGTSLQAWTERLRVRSGTNSGGILVTGSTKLDGAALVTGNTELDAGLLVKGNTSLGDGSTLATSTDHVLATIATLHGGSGDERAVQIDITGNGTTATAQTALRVNLLQGYAGSNQTIGMEVDNKSEGTGTDLNMGNAIYNPAGNSGQNSFAWGTTVGSNVGGQNEAANGNLNVGTLSKAVKNKANSLNIGSISIAKGTAIADTIIGAYIGLDAEQSDLHQASAALVVSNGTTSTPIARFQDNNTNVYVIEAGGDQITWKGLKLVQGTGSPETVITAPIGSMYLRTDAGTSTLYIKQTGTGNTGWVGK